MKNMLTLILFVILALGSIMSCTKEKIETIITYSVNESYISNSLEVFIWITNEDGEVLSELKLSNNSSGEINILTGEDGRFSLHELKKNNYFEKVVFDLKTYSNINTKSFHFRKQKIRKSYYLNAQDGTIHFSNIPEHDFHIISSGRSLIEGEFLENYVHIPKIYKPNNYYCYLRGADNGYYKYLNDFESQNIMNVSIDSFNTDMTAHQISTNNEHFLINIESFGLEYNLIKNDLYRNHFFPTPYKKRKDIFHTPNDDAYDNYTTSITAGDINNTRKRLYYTNVGAIPSSFEAIDADIDYSSYNNENLIIQTYGEYDEFKYSILSSSTEKSTSWYYRGATSQYLQFPKIPKIISDLYPEIKKNYFYDPTFNSITISANEYSNCSNFDDLMSKTFDQNQNEFYFNFDVIKSVNYSIN